MSAWNRPHPLLQVFPDPSPLLQQWLRLGLRREPSCGYLVDIPGKLVSVQEVNRCAKH